jgi:O-antigen/teichoic acid export membrane protein
MPSLLVQLNDDTARQMAAFTRAVQAIVIAALPLAIGFGLAAPLVIHLLWHGKWDIAAHATQILAACVPAWLVIHATRALLEARGFWRLRFALLAVNGAGGISAAAVGTLFNSVESIAAAVAVFYVSFSLSLLLVLSRLGLSLRDVTAIAIKPLAVNFTALLCSAGLTRWMFADHDAATLAALQPAAFLLSTVVGNLALFRDEWTALLKGFTARRRIPGQSPAP